MRSSEEVQQALLDDVIVPDEWQIGKTRSFGTAEVRLGELGHEVCIIEVTRGDIATLVTLWHRDAPNRWKHLVRDSENYTSEIPGEVFEVQFPEWDDATSFVETIAEKETAEELVSWREQDVDQDDWDNLFYSLVSSDISYDTVRL